VKGLQIAQFARTYRLHRLFIADLTAYRRSHACTDFRAAVEAVFNPWERAYDRTFNPFNRETSSDRPVQAI